MGVSTGRIATETCFDNDAIPGHGCIVPRLAGCGVGTRGQGSLNNFSTIHPLRDQRLLQRGAIEDVNTPRQEQVVSGGNLSTANYDLDCLCAGDCLPDIQRMRDPLDDKDVRLYRESVRTIICNHRGGLFRSPGKEAGKLRRIGPAGIWSRTDWWSSRRLKVELGSHRRGMLARI